MNVIKKTMKRMAYENTWKENVKRKSKQWKKSICFTVKKSKIVENVHKEEKGGEVIHEKVDR